MNKAAQIGLFFALASGFLSACAHAPPPTTEERMQPAKDSISDALVDQNSEPQFRGSGKTVSAFINSEAMLFDWPIDRAKVSRGFLPNKKRPHLGLDLTGPRGTPILSAQQGSVVYAGRDFRGFGNMVLIESGQGWATIYGHLEKILVTEGQRVSQGETIGTMGRSGRATGVHLHFEIRKDKGPVDPLPLLPSIRSIASDRKKTK